MLTRGAIGTFDVALFYGDVPVGEGTIARRTPVTYGMIGFAVGYQPGGADLPRPRRPGRGHPRRAGQGRHRARGPPAGRPGQGAPQGPRHAVTVGRLARMSDPYAEFPALTFDRPSDGVLRITLDAPGLNAVGPGRPRAAGRRVARRRPRSRHARGAAPRRGQGLLGGRELRADRLGHQRRRRAAADPARGARPGGEPHRLRDTDRVGRARSGGGRRAGRRAAGRRLGRRPHGSHHRWPHAPRGGGGRPRGDLLAAPLRDGQGQVPPAHLRHAHRRGGRAHRAGVDLRRRRRGARPRRSRWPSSSPRAHRTALRFTKHTLNHWYRAQLAAFDASLAYEFLGFGIGDADEGLAAHVEKRAPRFNP